MENFEKVFTRLQLHPVVDHFSIALLVVAVAIDIVALIFSQRLSLRHTALTLIIIGAIAAALSYVTGDAEGDRVWDLVTVAKAKDILKLHAQIGYYLMIVFAVLALWRILIEVLGFMQATRQIYLALAVVAVLALLYQGSLGGSLVYTYGVGTGAMAAGASAGTAQIPASETSAVSAAPTPIPTVYVPTAAATPAPTAAAPEASPSPAAEASPEKGPEPSGVPSASPSV